MKWTVSIEFSSSLAFHKFFTMLNTRQIRNAQRTNYSIQHKIIEFVTTSQPDEARLRKFGNVVDVKIVEIHES